MTQFGGHYSQEIPFSSEIFVLWSPVVLHLGSAVDFKIFGFGEVLLSRMFVWLLQKSLGCLILFQVLGYAACCIQGVGCSYRNKPTHKPDLDSVREYIVRLCKLKEQITFLKLFLLRWTVFRGLQYLSLLWLTKRNTYTIHGYFHCQYHSI